MKSYTILKNKTVGDLLLIADATSLLGIYFADCDHAEELGSDYKPDSKNPVLQQTVKELTEYFKGGRKTFSVPLHYEGTEFQHEIWNQIARIPFGETISYTELARRSGAPTALRGTGTATGRNPISIIVPCHRVVGKNGGLGGYAGGLDRKKRLLAIETSEIVALR